MHAVLASIASSCLLMQALGACTGVQSGINLAKVHDGVAPINYPCHSPTKCEGSIICCATVGTCEREEGKRGVFPHTSNKGYFEGGCSPRSLNKTHEDYEPDCTQVGECHAAYIFETR